jgi:hypothetical protein
MVQKVQVERTNRRLNAKNETSSPCERRIEVRAILIKITLTLALSRVAGGE